MSFTVTLDPPAAITGRTELDLNNGPLQADKAGIDWGEALIKAYLAEQQYGEGPVSFRVPNRIITIPLLVGAEVTETIEDDITSEEEARRKLNEKVALLQRQGGVVLRQRPGHEPLYADIVNASLTLPDVYGETGGVEPNASLKLECLPDFYGEELTLDAVEQDGEVVAVLGHEGSQATIKGDYPARTRIVLTEKAKHDQKGLLWGVRSTHYDSAATAALFYDAKDMTPINSASVVAKGGSYSGEGIELAEPQIDAWHPFMTTDIAAGPSQLTHIGSYRIWVRVWGIATGQQLRLAWSTDDATQPTINAQQGIVGGEGFSLIDLGEIRLMTPPVGEHWWRGILQVLSQSASAVFVDRIWLQPVDDGAGRLRATSSPASTLLNAIKVPTAFADGGGGLNVWTPEDPEHPGYATCKPGEHSPFLSNELVADACGFAIPPGVTITGIEVSGVLNLFPAFPETELRIGLGPGTTLKKQAFASGEHPFTYGGPTDLWGKAEWTPEEINSGEFGAHLRSFFAASGTVGISRTMTIKVYYSYSATGLPEDAVLYSERQSEVRFDGAYREDTTTEAYVRVSQETGDLVRIPPSGLENRPVELFIKNSRNTLDGAVDPGIDKVQAQVLYRPCYIGRL